MRRLRRAVRAPGSPLKALTLQLSSFLESLGTQAVAGAALCSIVDMQRFSGAISRYDGHIGRCPERVTVCKRQLKTATFQGASHSGALAADFTAIATATMSGQSKT